MVRFKKIFAVTAISVPLLFGFKTIKDSTNYAGTACDLSNKSNVYYTEEYSEQLVDGKHVQTSIVYKDKAGKTFAGKTLNYSDDKIKPDFRMEDRRTGYIEGAEVIGNTIKVFYKEANNKPLNSKILTVPGTAIIDGGFNYYVKDKWNDIVKGADIHFNFVVPERLDYYSFRIVKDKEIVCNGKPAYVFRMEPGNYILRQIIDPIVLTYEKSTKRLIKYEGISNLNDNKGKRYIVSIVYPEMGP
jgi:hypothetical protein